MAFSHGSFIFHPRRRPAQRRALPRASFGLATLDWRLRRRGSVVGAGTIVPGSWRSLVMFRRRRMLRSSADAPFSRLIRTLPLCALQVHEVLAGKFSISPFVVRTREIFICCGFITKMLAKDDAFEVSSLRRPVSANSQQ